MRIEAPIAWRTAAALLWIGSIVCLFKAVGDGAAAERSLYTPHLTATDRIVLQHLSAVADRWAAAGWILQFATAAALSLGIVSPRIVRRIFVSLGVLIAVDGVTLLLMAVIVR